jgi:hypothetical protein
MGYLTSWACCSVATQPAGNALARALPEGADRRRFAVRYQVVRWRWTSLFYRPYEWLQHDRLVLSIKNYKKQKK